MNDNEMKGEAKVSAEAEPPGLRCVVNRNGGDSRSGGEPHVNKCGAEMGVTPAEATNNKCGRAGPARGRLIENND